MLRKALFVGIVALIIMGIMMSWFAYSKRVEQERISYESQIQELKDEIEKSKHPLGGVDQYGQLAVKGSQLVDASGSPIQLRGLSSHGLRWYYEYLNFPALKYLKDSGANLCRLAAYTEPSGAYLDDPEHTLKTLYLATENVLAADMYALVDWHILNDSDPNLHTAKAIEFFDKVSTQYANNPGIIYEICNEPSGTTTWADVAKYANQVIPVIRENSPNAVIIVGTPSNSTDLHSVVPAPLEFENIMYSYHMYTAFSQGGYVYEVPKALDANLAVFVSEWGINYEPGEEEVNYTHARDFLDFLDERSISWAFWSLSNKDEVYSVLKSDSTRLSAWTDEDFSRSGKFILDEFQTAKKTQR